MACIKVYVMDIRKIVISCSDGFVYGRYFISLKNIVTHRIFNRL